MGAWGYKVFSNDTSCDFMADLEAPIEKLLKKKHVQSYDYDEYRAAAEFVIRMSPCYIFEDEDIVVPLIERLQKVLADDMWTSNWKSSRSIKRDLQRQIEALSLIHKKFKRKFGN